MFFFFPFFALNMCNVTRHNNTFAPAVSLRQMTRGRVERLRKPLSFIQSLWEQLICQHHYEPLISWPAPVFGHPGVLWAPLSSLPTTLRPQKLRRGLGIPIHGGWSTGQQPEEKAAVMRERKKGVCTHVPFCAFNYLPSCLPRPCPHNRVLTGAVSRQHYSVTTVGTGVSQNHIISVFVWHWKPASYS